MLVLILNVIESGGLAHDANTVPLLDMNTIEFQASVSWPHDDERDVSQQLRFLLHHQV